MRSINFNILIFSFFIIFIKWFFSFYYFNEPLNLKIIFESVTDGKYYYPLIKYLSDFNLSESFDPEISNLKNIIVKTLDINKAQDIISIDLKDKSSMADYMIIASGTSSRHIQSLSEQVLDMFKDKGVKNSKIEGKESSEWKLVDGIDIIVHIFHPEKRKFYELEKMWSELIPKEKLII